MELNGFCEVVMEISHLKFPFMLLECKYLEEDRTFIALKLKAVERHGCRLSQ